jgi:sugar phosphate isomerase/epimerase
MNVHPGESLAQVRSAIADYAAPIRDRVFGKEIGGIELRIGIGAARDLRAPRAREEFRALLDALDLRVFSINAYPLLDFQARRVKENAYRPPWTGRVRPRWTREIAGILADLLHPSLTGSVSTLGGTYRAWGHGAAARARIARGYLEVVEELRHIEERTGKRIVLAVEPEPDTTFETADDVIEFFEERLWPAAREQWAGTWSAARIEEVLRRHFTVNLDTCHLSVVFRPPAGEMEKLARAGISIGKVHVTSALAVPRPARSPKGWRALRAMNEPRYLHQVRGAGPDGEEAFSCPDLDRLPASPAAALSEVRSHFHVPVYSAGWDGLKTTHDETREAVERAVRKRECRQLVIETYTWPVMKGEKGRSGGRALINGIAREFRWLLGVIERAR